MIFGSCSQTLDKVGKGNSCFLLHLSNGKKKRGFRNGPEYTFLSSPANCEGNFTTPLKIGLDKWCNVSQKLQTNTMWKQLPKRRHREIVKLHECLCFDCVAPCLLSFCHYIVPSCTFLSAFSCQRTTLPSPRTICSLSQPLNESCCLLLRRTRYLNTTNLL